MIVYNLLRVVLHLFIGMATCALVFPRTDAADRQARIRQWSIKLLAICGVRVEIKYAPGTQSVARALIVANHVSWLDIFVINSLHPCRFVAKAAIRNWPLIGWLCEKTGTVFIAHGRLRDVRRIYENLVASLGAGEHVAFFPEGTTAGQGTLLPFHANLFEAAIDAKVPIQPYALRYFDVDGNLHAAVDFIGEMTFAASLVTILRARRIEAELILLPTIATGAAQRRELAAAARCAIAATLGYPAASPAADIADTRPETLLDPAAARQ